MGDLETKGGAGLPILGERRLVCVLFVDMVGFAAAIEPLDEERALRFARAFQDLVGQALRSQGGTIGPATGDGTMAVFGIPTAIEDPALRAARAALAIRASLAERAADFLRDFGHAPQVRIGISAGQVIASARELDDSGMLAIGNVVNLASRIQNLAPEGGVVLCDAAADLLEGQADLDPMGELRIKGLSQLHRLWRLDGLPEQARRFDGARARGLSPLVGRDQDLAELGAALDKARSGQLSLVDLVAEPGLGKTRLIHEFLHRPQLEGLVVLEGQCRADLRDGALHPIVGLVTRAFGLAERDQPQDSRAKVEAGLQRMGLASAQNIALLLNLFGVPQPADSLVGLDGVLIGLRTRDLLMAMLQGAAKDQVLVLILEDIHWMDAASQDFLRSLVSGPAQNLPLLIVQSRRPEFFPDWLEPRHSRSLSLAPLAPQGFADLASARLGGAAVPEALVSLIAERAGGNPLFGEEILTHLTKSGALAVREGRVLLDKDQALGALPGSLQALFAARLGQLEPEERALLQLASVLGRRFDPQALAQAGVAGPAGLKLLLDRLVDRDFLVPLDQGGDMGFKHVLMRDAVYSSLLSKDKEALHLTIARGLEADMAVRGQDHAEALAYHYGRTQDRAKAFQFAVLAGKKSLGLYFLTEAETHFAAALAEYDSDPTCAPDEDLGDFLASYMLCLNLTLRGRRLVNMADRLALPLQRAGQWGHLVKVLHHQVAALILCGRYREAEDVALRMLPMAEPLGDGAALAYALVSRLAVACYAAPISRAEAQTLAARIETLLDGLPDAYLRNYFLAHLAFDKLCRGLVIDANAEAERLLQAGQWQADPRAMGYGLAMRALIAMCTDDHAEAMAMSEKALDVSRANFEVAIASSSRISAMIPLAVPGAMEALRTYVALCAENGWRLFSSGPEAMQGIALAMEGRLGPAIRHLKQVIARREAEGARASADWSRLYLCEVYLEVLAPRAPASALVVLRNLPVLAGILLTGRQRVLELTAQIRRNPQMDPDGHYIARVELFEGLVAGLSRQKDKARQHLQEALRIVRPSGASPLRERIEAALAKLG